MAEMKLLGTAASPFVNRVQFVLNLKSIEYEFIEENIACKSELLLASNPVYKKIPVLLQTSQPPICESLIIIEYLDEIRPDIHQILPHAPSDRAHNRLWASFIDSKIVPLFIELAHSEDKEAAKNQLKEVSRMLEEVFVEVSNGKDYFGGDDVGYLDVVLGCYLVWILCFEKIHVFKIFDEVTTPGLAKWAKIMLSHEAVKSVIPEEKILMDIYMRKQKIKPPRAS